MYSQAGNDVEPAFAQVEESSSNTLQADRVPKMASMLRHCSISAEGTTLFAASRIGPIGIVRAFLLSHARPVANALRPLGARGLSIRKVDHDESATHA